MIKENLWFGVQDGQIPPYPQILAAVPLLTPEIFEIKSLAGSHSEYLAQLVQKGLILGGYAFARNIFISPISRISISEIRNDSYRPQYIWIFRGGDTADDFIFDYSGFQFQNDQQLLRACV